MKENLQAINKNAQKLNEHIKEVERILGQLRDCWEDHRDFVWEVMDNNNVLDPAGKPALSLVASTGRMNGGFEALKALGMLPMTEEELDWEQEKAAYQDDPEGAIRDADNYRSD